MSRNLVYNMIIANNSTKIREVQKFLQGFFNKEGLYKQINFNEIIIYSDII